MLIDLVFALGDRLIVPDYVALAMQQVGAPVVGDKIPFRRARVLRRWRDRRPN